MPMRISPSARFVKTAKREILGPEFPWESQTKYVPKRSRATYLPEIYSQGVGQYFKDMGGGDEAAVPV